MDADQRQYEKCQKDKSINHKISNNITSFLIQIQENTVPKLPRGDWYMDYIFITFIILILFIFGGISFIRNSLVAIGIGLLLIGAGYFFYLLGPIIIYYGTNFTLKMTANSFLNKDSKAEKRK